MFSVRLADTWLNGQEAAGDSLCTLQADLQDAEHRTGDWGGDLVTVTGSDTTAPKKVR